MKNIFKLIVLSLFLYSCGDFEPVIYDESNVGIGFNTGSTNAVVTPSGTVVTIPVEATNITNADRSFNVSVDTEEEIDPETTTGSAADYTVGTITIPAGEFQGNLTVTFGNYDNLPDLITQKLVLDLDLPAGVGVIGSDTTEINYIKAVICNDLVLTLNEDAYADERDWNITDSDGNIVVQCSDFTDCPGGAPSGSIPAAQYVYDITLEDGCYTFNITDSFGDGQFDGSITGGYSLECSVITHAANTGNWGASDSTDFCVNP